MPIQLDDAWGVQGQVMGLARALRKMGHEVRVLGPCDGAPPDTFVTPIGESLPTVANGSIAPLAPDPLLRYAQSGYCAMNSLMFCISMNH